MPPGETFPVVFRTARHCRNAIGEKLGQDTKYLRVIGRVEGVHSVHYVHGVTDKQTNQLQYFALVFLYI